MLRNRTSSGSIFSSVSFNGQKGNDATGAILQNIQQLPLEQELTFGKVNRESSVLLDLEVCQLAKQSPSLTRAGQTSSEDLLAGLQKMKASNEEQKDKK